MTALELAVRFGKTLLIQEMDSIDPALFPILRGDFISHGPRLELCVLPYLGFRNIIAGYIMARKIFYQGKILREFLEICLFFSFERLLPGRYGVIFENF